MQRVSLAAAFAAGLLVSMAMAKDLPPAAGSRAAEPVPIQLLRIEMRKALLQQDAAPKMTAARQAKLQFVQAAKTDAVADAEVDLIEAQTSESVASLNAKSVETQLKDALKNSAAMQAQTQPAASATDISLLQLEAQKARIQADAAVKVADNRKQVMAQTQANYQAGKTNAGQFADAQADVIATDVNAGLLNLELEACQLRLDAALKSISPAK